MHEDVALVLDSAEDSMKKSVVHLKSELQKLQAGKANPVMLAGVKADYYGAPTPIEQMSSVLASDARTLTITPFEKKSLAAIEKAIIAANLGFNPQNDGTVIRINIPMLTEERRRELVKRSKDEGENAKISIRNIRREHNSELKKLKDDGVSEDMIKGGEDDIQKLTDRYVAKVDEVIKAKEAEVMTI